jgi:phosphohistidine phosphatase
VGHLPFLSRLASRLLAGDEDADVVSFRKGGVVCLQRGETGRWSVAWMVVPDVVRAR